jgi:rubrerythrin
MNTSIDTIHEILRKAYQIEVDGYTFYSMAAERATKPRVEELFAKLAKDEVEHKAYLRQIMRSYEHQGAAAFLVERAAPDLRAFSDTIFTEEFKSQAAGAVFEMSALSIGMQLETNAIAHFTNAASNASDDEVRDFYHFLADWEKQHLEALSLLLNAVRDDFWVDGRFAPF